jgi:hypothetical protein
MAVTAIYRALMLEIERRRLQLGWTMEEVCAVAGVQDRYYPKMLYVDEPSGRQARWETIEILMLTLFPDGYDMKLEAREGGMLTAMRMRHHIKHSGPPGTPSRRQEMAALSRMATDARRQIPAERRTELARHAAQSRWGKRVMDAEGSVDETAESDREPN